jgi:hypothetical protein
MAEETCLHCQINEVVLQFLEETLQSGGTADAPEITSMMAESIVDVILQQEVGQQANLLAATVASLGELFLRKSGAVEGESTATH